MRRADYHRRDYFGGPFVALGEIVRCNYSAYPNVKPLAGPDENTEKLGQGCTRVLPADSPASLKDKGLRGRLRRWLTSAGGAGTRLILGVLLVRLRFRGFPGALLIGKPGLTEGGGDARFPGALLRSGGLLRS